MTRKGRLARNLGAASLLFFVGKGLLWLALALAAASGALNAA